MGQLWHGVTRNLLHCCWNVNCHIPFWKLWATPTKSELILWPSSDTPGYIRTEIQTHQKTRMNEIIKRKLSTEHTTNGYQGKMGDYILAYSWNEITTIKMKLKSPISNNVMSWAVCRLRWQVRDKTHIWHIYKFKNQRNSSLVLEIRKVGTFLERRNRKVTTGWRYRGWSMALKIFYSLFLMVFF